MRMKNKWGWQHWVSWILQCFSYITGIALAIKQFIPVGQEMAHLPNKGFHLSVPTPPTPSPNFFILAGIVVVMIIITFGGKYWRNR